jgi:uncharacterized RDD family membrane protein YckC
MSSMPEDGATGQQGNRQQTVRPDVPAQPDAPPDNVPQQNQQAPQQQAPPQQPYYGSPGRLVVPRDETKVTGHRVVQYVIDYILAGIIPAIAYWAFDRGSGFIGGFGWLVATVIALAAYFIYWVTLPYGHRGQTFGMRLLGIHVISKDGSKASMMQLFVRGIFLIIDTLVFGLVGFITILCSKYRQRIGDHAAQTVVVPARYGPQI